MWVIVGFARALGIESAWLDGVRESARAHLDTLRLDMVRREVGGLADGRIQVVEFNSLLMNFAESQGASMIIRGLRAVADFEYEFQMAGMNQQLNDDIETIFLMAGVSLQPIASRLVKEIARYGGSIDKFVTPAVAADVKRQLEGEAGA